MALTEADWKARTPITTVPPRPHTMLNEVLLRQAVVDSTLLTGHLGWDKYLQRLQVWLEDAQLNLAEWRGKIDGAYADADLRLVQTNVNIYQARIAVLTQCMSLPKEIVAHADESLDKS